VREAAAEKGGVRVVVAVRTTKREFMQAGRETLLAGLRAACGERVEVVIRDEDIAYKPATFKGGGMHAASPSNISMQARL
jgi:hypothetical protein